MFHIVNQQNNCLEDFASNIDNKIRAKVNHILPHLHKQSVQIILQWISKWNHNKDTCCRIIYGEEIKTLVNHKIATINEINNENILFLITRLHPPNFILRKFIILILLTSSGKKHIFSYIKCHIFLTRVSGSSRKCQINYLANMGK